MNGSIRTAIAVSQVLPADARHHLRALADDQLLRRAFTGYAYQPRRWLERAGRSVDGVLGTKVTACLARRPEIAGVPAESVRMTWFAEAAGLLLNRRRGQRAIWAHLDQLQTRLSRIAARRLEPDDRIVLAREFEAQEVFQEAAKADLLRVYHLPTAHYDTVDRILRRELELYPDTELLETHEWSMSPPRIERKKTELALASRVLVPSQFVKQSLLDAGIAEEKIYVLPFGAEAEWITDSLPPKNPSLFVHIGQLSIRKGTHRLLRAWKRLGAYRTCELRLIGTMQLSEQFLAEFQGMYNYLGRMPRHALRPHFANASSFILPALAEGFAVVILEALSCGTPVVVSRNSGAEGFISAGGEGLLHDAQDDEQLCDALESMLAYPNRCKEMAQNCIQKARNWTWEHYRTEFVKFIRGLLNDAELQSS